ncbi:MAG TPA: hypothetical protein DEQ41_14550 [Shewanella sp.]|uniref:Transposase IS204/IS1001/IS1096/IS1165 DDE domain-containing protein n=1 Tax=Shewanella chilikensis TaxID=558541 RepID=A0A6G7LY93_9GAMM|nr:hypothetical protein GII14_12265 [Shewanella chilikensis]HCD14935.1 hypothetical protein [Shewanella sp.]
MHGIVASAVHPLHTCRMEGMNNKIKLLKQWAKANGIPNTSL